VWHDFMGYGGLPVGIENVMVALKWTTIRATCTTEWEERIEKDAQVNRMINTFGRFPREKTSHHEAETERSRLRPCAGARDQAALIGLSPKRTETKASLLHRMAAVLLESPSCLLTLTPSHTIKSSTANSRRKPPTIALGTSAKNPSFAHFETLLRGDPCSAACNWFGLVAGTGDRRVRPSAACLLERN
jgi:hypothetical protein